MSNNEWRIGNSSSLLPTMRRPAHPPLGCPNTGNKDRYQFVTLRLNFGGFFRRTYEPLPLHKHQPDTCLPQFLQYHFHLVDKVLPGLCTTCLPIVGSRRCATSHQLACNVIPDARLRQRLDNIENLHGEFEESFLQIVLPRPFLPGVRHSKFDIRHSTFFTCFTQGATRGGFSRSARPPCRPRVRGAGLWATRRGGSPPRPR